MRHSPRPAERRRSPLRLPLTFWAELATLPLLAALGLWALCGVGNIPLATVALLIATGFTCCAAVDYVVAVGQRDLKDTLRDALDALNSDPGKEPNQ
jgi:hypothetical protein